MKGMNALGHAGVYIVFPWQVLSENTVLCNVYQVFLLLAVKVHTTLRTLGLRGLRLRKYTKFLRCKLTNVKVEYTVDSSNKGHFKVNSFVPCREVARR